MKILRRFSGSENALAFLLSSTGDHQAVALGKFLRASKSLAVGEDVWEQEMWCFQRCFMENVAFFQEKLNQVDPKAGCQSTLFKRLA